MEQDAPALGAMPQAVHDVIDLVDAIAFPGWPRMPLRTIHRTQVAFFGRPLIPNTDPIFAQPLSIGVAAQKPDQLVDDAFKMHPLGGQDGKPCREVES